jgi:hypothetical protein
MLDTQDAQVMPLTCKKHFCGATVLVGGGVFDEWPGPWFSGSTLTQGATSFTDPSVLPVVCSIEFPALSFLTWLVE